MAQNVSSNQASPNRVSPDSAIRQLRGEHVGEYVGEYVRDIHAVFREGEGLLLIRLMPWSYYRLKTWDSFARYHDSLWHSLPKPNQNFFPVKAVRGQHRNLLVLDAARQTVWQYDDGLQLLTGMEVPEEIARFDLSSLDVFWTDQNRLLFVNSREGMVFQTLEQSGKLEILRKDRIPLKARHCYQARWPGRAEEKQAAFLCAENREVIFYNAFFSERRSLSLKEFSLPDTLNPSPAKPVLYRRDGNWNLLYPLGNHWLCHNPQSGSLGYCKP